MIDSKLYESLENYTISHLNTLKNPTQGFFYFFPQDSQAQGSIHILGVVIFVIVGQCFNLVCGSLLRSCSMYKGSVSHLDMKAGFTSIAFYCLTSRCQPWTGVQLLWQSRNRGGLPGRNPTFPLQRRFLGVQSPGIISPSPTQVISFEQVLFISIIIFDTYILAADTYYCLSQQVSPSLMAQSGYLPEPMAEPELGSAASLELQGAQTRQPAAKPHPHRLLQHYNWCYSEEQSNSYGNIPCVLKKKKKLLVFWNSVEWPFDQRLNTLTHQISVIMARGFRCRV